MSRFTEKAISDMREGDSVTGKFAIRDKETPKEYRNKAGKYFFLRVGDKTGNMVLKYWGGEDPARVMELYNGLAVGDVIEAAAEVAVDRFDGKLTMTMEEGLHTMRKCGAGEYSPADFLPVTQKDVNAMIEEIFSAIRAIQEPSLRALLESLFSDREFVEAFKEAPGSMMYHHNYIGGNLEHTANVVKLCGHICDIHGELDRDLVLTGAILHDIGKIGGYSYTTSIEVSDEGKFLGHVATGYRMVSSKIAALEGFPKELAMKLESIILSHHRNKEWGAIMRLSTPEAAAVHYADEADSQVKNFLQYLEAESDNEDSWVYIKGLGHEIYTKRS